MNNSTRTRPDRSVLLQAVELAVRAPSIHNTQPWLWRIGDDTIDLFADPSRRLRIVDPGRRALLVSCGAALFQARLALSAAGWRTVATRLPNLFDDDHLANVLVTGPAAATKTDLRLADAARRRRTDRRPFSMKPLGNGVVAALRDAVIAEGASLHEVTRLDDRLVLAVAAGRANEAEEADPGYRAELARWSGRPAGSVDGVPVSAVPHLPGRQSEVELRNFEIAAPGTLPTNRATTDERAAMFVIATDRQGPLEQLRAGEALEHILLTAVDIGLSVSPYTQPLEVPGPHAMLQRVLGGLGQPQIVLRVGWPGPGAEPPLTPRRPLADVLDHSER